MKNNIVKVLHMAPLGNGGISKLTVSINSKIDLEKVKFDYLVFKNDKAFYEDIVKQFGAEKKYVNLGHTNNKFLLYWKKMRGVEALLKREHYDIMHVDASTPMDAAIALGARLAGVKTIIMHSHSASDGKRGIFRYVYMCLCKIAMKFAVTDYFAISRLAAKYIFPYSIYKSNKYHIIPNGIEVDAYRFDSSVREGERYELGIKDEFVLGHVGRFTAQKNHKFIIDVFNELQKLDNNVKLLLIGGGELYQDIKDRVQEHGLNEKVIFYGPTMKVTKLLMAMDAFIFPSESEGLGLVGIEAQSAGLPTYCSEAIQDEAMITPLAYRIDGYNAKYWAERILNNRITERKDYGDMIKNAGFDLNTMVNDMQKFYLSKVKEN